MSMSTPAFPELAAKAVREGRLDESLIDAACRRILRMKFRLGLFDGSRYPAFETRGEVIGCAARRPECHRTICAGETPAIRMFRRSQGV